MSKKLGVHLLKLAPVSTFHLWSAGCKKSWPQELVGSIFMQFLPVLGSWGAELLIFDSSSKSGSGSLFNLKHSVPVTVLEWPPDLMPVSKPRQEFPFSVAHHFLFHLWPIYIFIFYLCLTKLLISYFYSLFNSLIYWRRESLSKHGHTPLWYISWEELTHTLKRNIYLVVVSRFHYRHNIQVRRLQNNFSSCIVNFLSFTLLPHFISS